MIFPTFCFSSSSVDLRVLTQKTHPKNILRNTPNPLRPRDQVKHFITMALSRRLSDPAVCVQPASMDLPTRRQSLFIPSSTKARLSLSHVALKLRMTLRVLDALAPTEKAKVPRENTYRLEPKAGRTFSVKSVEEVIKRVLASALAHESYNPARCSQLARNISDRIKNEVKKLKFERLKIVCQVSLGEQNQQAASVASRCLWDQDRDNYCCLTYETDTIFAIATVYGVYFE